MGSSSSTSVTSYTEHWRVDHYAHASVDVAGPPQHFQILHGLKCRDNCNHDGEVLCEPLEQQCDPNGPKSTAYFKICRTCPSIRLVQGTVRLDLLKERMADSMAISLLALEITPNVPPNLCAHSLLRFVGRVKLRVEDRSTRGDAFIADGSFPVYQCVVCGGITDVMSLLNCIKLSTSDPDTHEAVKRLDQTASSFGPSKELLALPAHNSNTLVPSQPPTLRGWFLGNKVNLNDPYCLAHSIVNVLNTWQQRNLRGCEIGAKAIEAVEIAIKNIQKIAKEQESINIARGCALLSAGLVRAVNGGRCDVAFNFVTVLASLLQQDTYNVLEYIGMATCQSAIVLEGNIKHSEQPCQSPSLPQSHAMFPFPDLMMINGTQNFHSFEEYFRTIVITERSKSSLFSSSTSTSISDHTRTERGQQYLHVQNCVTTNIKICALCGHILDESQTLNALRRIQTSLTLLPMGRIEYYSNPPSPPLCLPRFEDFLCRRQNPQTSRSVSMAISPSSPSPSPSSFSTPYPQTIRPSEEAQNIAQFSELSISSEEVEQIIQYFNGDMAAALQFLRENC